MRRFLWIWLTLLGAFPVARTAVSLTTSGWVGWSAETWLQLVTVPAFQAVAIWWVTRGPGRLWQDVLQPTVTPWLAVWLGWDVLVLALGALLPEQPFLTPYGALTLGGLHKALEGAAAGLVAMACARQEPSPRDRAWTASLAVWLPVLGSAFLFAWPDRLAAQIAPRLTPLLATIAVYGALLAVSVGLALRMVPAWLPQAPVPARLLEAAAGFALLAAVLGSAHLVLRPDEPWPLGARACAFFAVTLALLACIGAFWEFRVSSGSSAHHPSQSAAGPHRRHAADQEDQSRDPEG